MEKKSLLLTCFVLRKDLLQIFKTFQVFSKDETRNIGVFLFSHSFKYMCKNQILFESSSMFIEIRWLIKTLEVFWIN